MKKVLFVLALVLGCDSGPPAQDFSGQWSGTRRFANQCDGGPLVILPPDDVAFSILQSGHSLTIVRKYCEFDVDADVSTAKLYSPHTCDEQTDSKGSWVTTYTAGSLALSDGKLTYSFTSQDESHDNDGTVSNCISTESGTLSR